MQGIHSWWDNPGLPDSLFCERPPRMSIRGRAKESRQGEKDLFSLWQKIWLGRDKPLSKIPFLISYPL